MIGRRGTPGVGHSLVIKGHMDVVPAEDASRWSRAPFEPTRVDCWLVGCGAGDMKARFAAGLLAIWALDQADPGWLTGSLFIVSVIE